MKINIPDDISKILQILNMNNFNGYIVGGSVRDSILGKTPKDWDITTDARPEEVIEIFKDYRIICTGLKHGTVTLLIDDKPYEITTYRIDGEYKDGRHPESVTYTDNIVIDLSRRDFTINAMAYNESKGLVDPYGGFHDLRNSIIRCVGNPDKRFKEDALRMLRAIRFSTELNFRIEKTTLDSIISNSSLISRISKERIRDELNKILLSDYPSKGIWLLAETGLMDFIIPQLKKTIGFEQHHPKHDKDVFEHTMEVLDNTKPHIVTRLAALLHDIGKPMTFTLDDNNIGHFIGHNKVSSEIAEEILTDLRYSKDIIIDVCHLIKEHMIKFDTPSPKSIKKVANRIGKHNMLKLIDLIYADIKGSKPPHDFSSIMEIERLWNEILTEKQPLTVKDLEVNGNDIIEMGVEEGKEIGMILKKLLEIVLENPELNKKELLKEEIKKMIN